MLWRFVVLRFLRLTLDSSLFPSLSRMKRAFTVYREGSCNNKQRSLQILQLCWVTSGKHRGLGELCSPERHSCTHKHSSYIWLCVPSVFNVHVNPAFAAMACFIFTLTACVQRGAAAQEYTHSRLYHREGWSRNQRRGFRPGTKFCYALTSIDIHSQSVSQNLAQSFSSVWMNQTLSVVRSRVSHYQTWFICDQPRGWKSHGKGRGGGWGGKQRYHYIV